MRSKLHDNWQLQGTGGSPTFCLFSVSDCSTASGLTASQRCTFGSTHQWCVCVCMCVFLCLVLKASGMLVIHSGVCHAGAPGRLHEGPAVADVAAGSQMAALHGPENRWASEFAGLSLAEQGQDHAPNTWAAEFHQVPAVLPFLPAVGVSLSTPSVPEES